MAKHVCFLDQENSKRRRTVADAMQVLRLEAAFADDHTATIVVRALNLPSGEVAGLIAVQYQRDEDDAVFVVSLPTAVHFRGKDASSRPFRRDVWLLDQAVVDSANTIVTADGSTLRGVEIEPLNLPEQPTELDWRIVHYTLEHIGARDCYRHVRDGVPADLHRFIPDHAYLDCSELTGLEIPPLKVLARVFAQKDWTLRNLSHQKIADALAKFGIRRPAPRPRLRGRRNLATNQIGSKLLHQA